MDKTLRSATHRSGHNTPLTANPLLEYVHLCTILHVCTPMYYIASALCLRNQYDVIRIGMLENIIHSNTVTITV